MNIAMLGNGEVARSLIKIIDQKQHKLYSFRRGASISEDSVFSGIYSDVFSIPQRKNIDIVIDLLGHNDDAIYISRKVIKDSLSVGKSVITPNKKLMRKYGMDLCDLAQNTNGELYINSLVASSKHFKKYPVYLSIYNFKEMNVNGDIFRYRGAGPDETAESINDEILRIWKINNAK